MKRLLIILFLLAFVGGYADAVSYLLTRSFTGHLTGNMVFLMIHSAEGAWRVALSNALAVAAFAAGTTLAAWLEADPGAPRAARTLRQPLLVESGFLALAAACRWWATPLTNDLTVMCLCAGLGLQNGALRRCGALSVHSTFITGMGTTLLTGLVRKTEHQAKPGDPPPYALGILAGILLVFALGAGIGAFLNRQFGWWGLGGIFVPLLTALALTMLDRQRGKGP